MHVGGISSTGALQVSVGCHEDKREILARIGAGVDLPFPKTVPLKVILSWVGKQKQGDGTDFSRISYPCHSMLFTLLSPWKHNSPTLFPYGEHKTKRIVKESELCYQTEK